MGDLPEASRPPPPEVPPILHQGVRYEQEPLGSDEGGRLGGYLAAIDPGSGQLLWRLKVYEVPEPDAPGLPPIGRYFRSMRLLPGNALEIENESGGRYQVDLATRTTTPSSTSTPSTTPSKKLPPKPSSD
jgi:hypothetical protein